MQTGDTIVAIASPPGESVRALVRCSGPAVATTLASLGLQWTGDRAARSGRLRLSGRTLPALLVQTPGPASYTGEDSAELVIPGAPPLVARILETLLAVDGVRHASPGEFSARAYLNGRLTIEQAEGVAMAVSARYDAEVDAAKRLLSGASGDRWRSLADDLAAALALVEAGVDFTDQEDVVAIAPVELDRRLVGLRERLDAALVGAGRVRTGAPTVVLAGAPSAGKSTLFNALLGWRRNVVDAAPGTTRDVIREPLRLGDGPRAMTVTLLDLAGLDRVADAGGTIERRIQETAREAISAADVVIWCDPTGRFRDELPVSSEARVLRVRTKADLPVSVASPKAIGVCAVDQWNLSALRRAMRDAADAGTAEGEDLSLLPRHADALRRAREGVVEALGLVAPAREARHLPEAELVAGAMRAALDAIGEISGAIDPDDVIGRVFTSFCIGK